MCIRPFLRSANLTTIVCLLFMIKARPYLLY
jgi:hypothetical protein